MLLKANNFVVFREYWLGPAAAPATQTPTPSVTPPAAAVTSISAPLATTGAAVAACASQITPTGASAAVAAAAAAVGVPRGSGISSATVMRASRYPTLPPVGATQALTSIAASHRRDLVTPPQQRRVLPPAIVPQYPTTFSDGPMAARDVSRAAALWPPRSRQPIGSRGLGQW